MSIFEKMKKKGHEQVIFSYDKETGLKSIIAIHDTTVGPALGGTRVKVYQNEEEALEDVLRLSEGMTYKNAAANFYMGGGKAVIMLDENNPKTIEKLRIHAQYINTLGGRFISAKDVGTTDSDVLTMSQVSQFVLGNKFPPSKFTAYGIFVSMKAAAKWRWNNESLKDKVIAIQGLGGVGYELARYCHEAGAKLIVADINPETIEKAKKEFNVEVVSVDTILEQECDILAPCALGAILNENSIPKIKTQIICGSANNQLAKDSDMKLIEQKGILYCPDYIVNCGGAIVVGSEYTNDPIEVATKKLEQTYDRLTTVFEIAKDKQISTAEAAFELAKSFIRTGLKIKKIDV